jgi:hypothetical protein
MAIVESRGGTGRTTSLNQASNLQGEVGACASAVPFTRAINTKHKHSTREIFAIMASAFGTIDIP